MCIATHIHSGIRKGVDYTTHTTAAEEKDGELTLCSAVQRKKGPGKGREKEKERDMITKGTEDYQKGVRRLKRSGRWTKDGVPQTRREARQSIGGKK